MLLILLYALLLLLSEGFAGFSLFGRFLGGIREYGQFYYSFAAMALVPVFGTALDLLRTKTAARRRLSGMLPSVAAVLGLAFLLLGGITHPFLLGLGRALFFTGAGTAVLVKDRETHKKSSDIGIFLSTGALGLFLGNNLGAGLPETARTPVLLGFAAAFSVLSFLILLISRKEVLAEESEKYREAAAALSEAEYDFRFGSGQPLTKAAVAALGACFVAAGLREYFGTTVSFPWTEDFRLTVTAAVFIALGTGLGGLFAAKTSFTVGTLFTLGPAVFLFWFKDVPVLAIIALFLFHMTIPVTLYMVSNRLKTMPGFSLGILSFAEFLGLLPAVFGLQAPVENNVLASFVSGGILVLLFIALVLLVGEHRKTAVQNASSAPEAADSGPSE